MKLTTLIALGLLASLYFVAAADASQQPVAAA